MQRMLQLGVDENLSYEEAVNKDRVRPEYYTRFRKIRQLELSYNKQYPTMHLQC